MEAGLGDQPFGVFEMLLKPRLHLLFGHSENIFLDEKIRVYNGPALSVAERVAHPDMVVRPRRSGAIRPMRLSFNREDIASIPANLPALHHQPVSTAPSRHTPGSISFSKAL